MKRRSIALAVLSLTILVLPALAPATTQVNEGYIATNLNGMPLAFTQNNGQWDEQVLFRADAGLATVWITKEGVYYQFTRRIEEGSDWSADPEQFLPDKFGLERDSVEQMVIKATFVEANINLSAAGEEVMEYKCNYFFGNDPAQWRTDVPNYSAVILKEIYPGIDLRYYGNGDGKLEYDFIVAPGADISWIQVQYEGANSVSVDQSGRLVVATDWTDVIEETPRVFQVVEGREIAIEGEYELLSDNTFGFHLGQGYDPSLPVVIDPVLSYSTYLGGGDSDESHGIAVDGSGCAYVIGWTQSSDFPTQNPYDGSYNGGSDVFVSKLSAAGNGLVYSTYLGGGHIDRGYRIAVDDLGCAYVTGYTWSSDFPTQNPYDGSHNGNSDAFVTKLSAAGNGLVYSTYLGAICDQGSDGGMGIGIDGSGCAYVAGWTQCSDFPTQNPFDGSYNGLYDVFVTKFSAAGNDLVYSTYLGGVDNDDIWRIVVDGSGCAYVTGWTESSDFPTQNPYDDSHNGGRDVYVTKLSAAGNNLIYSTYLGAGSKDEGWGLAVDGSGCAYVTGHTWSSDFPTLNAFDASYNVDSITNYSDAFVAKLSSAGSDLVYSTYLGGEISDGGYDVSVDRVGCAYVIGKTNSFDFPTLNAYDGSFNGDSNTFLPDVFVTQLSVAGNGLVYSTYLGGESSEYGIGIAVDGSGCAYVTGYTMSSDFPTQNPYDGSLNGYKDPFVTKLTYVCDCLPGDANGDGSINAGDAVYIIAFAFQGGPAPTPYATCSGDANGDCQCNVGDAVYLISYVFKGGPAPVTCDDWVANCGTPIYK